jgi:hypothetical protein
MFINDKQSTGRISRVVEITPLSPNLMLNSEEKKKKYSNSCVVRKKNSERNKKP